MIASRWCSGFRVLLATTALSATSVACRRPHVDGALATDAILNSWTAAGFETKGVAKVEPDLWSAGACSRGMVSGLEVLICEYASDEEANVGEKKINTDWEEETIPTGAVMRNSKTLLAVADRNKADRSGRTIARLLALFRDQH